MKKIFVDANVLIDHLSLKAEPYHKSWARTIIEYCYKNNGKVHVSSHSFMILYHFLQKEIDELSALKESMKEVLKLLNLVAVDREDIEFALVSFMSDFEDAVQLSCALKLKADFLITRNARDFYGTSLPIIVPDQFFDFI